MWQKINMRFRHWLVGRYPVQPEVVLTHKRIYIFPTWAGMAFFGVALLILVLAINYQNNLAYAICFTLVSLLMTVIMHTYANLSGLVVHCKETDPVFAGDTLYFRFDVSSPRALTQLQFSFPLQASVICDVPCEKNTPVYVASSCSVRGWQQPPLLRIASVYPLGVFRCWTWLRFAQPVLVYPCPIAGGDLSELNRPINGEMQADYQGEEDFQELKNYYVGAPLSRIAWKVYAKGQGLYIQSYQGEAAKERWLSWHLWPQLDTESRLSRLTYWAVQLHERQEPFGLILPSILIEPNRGEAHLHDVLRHLALYQGEVS